MHSGEQGTEWRIGSVPSGNELDIRNSRTKGFKPCSIVKIQKINIRSVKVNGASTEEILG
jgi:hypothetical protein